jgi:hypothetical protein
VYAFRTVSFSALSLTVMYGGFATQCQRL